MRFNCPLILDFGYWINKSKLIEKYFVCYSLELKVYNVEIACNVSYQLLLSFRILLTVLAVIVIAVDIS